MYYNLISDDYLMHHGVKGMKWGVRHDPEPIGKRSHTNAYRQYRGPNDKKKSFNAKRSLQIGASIAAGMLAAGAAAYLVKSGRVMALAKLGRKATLRAGGNARGLRLDKRTLSKGKEALKNTIQTKNRDVTRLRNSLLKSKRTVSEANPKKISLDKYAIKNGIKPLSNNSKAKDFEVINDGLKLSDDVKHTLEQFDNSLIEKLPFKKQVEYLKAFEEGSLMNCTKCSTAAIMRDMGYDVTAGKSTIGVEPVKQLSWWKDAKFESLSGASLKRGESPDSFYADIMSKVDTTSGRDSAIKQLTEKLTFYGEGAKGNLSVGGPNGFHSVEFRVSDGQARIFDNQLGIEYSSVYEFFNKIPAHNPNASMWMRLDNCKPDVRQMIKDDVIRARK